MYDTLSTPIELTTLHKHSRPEQNPFPTNIFDFLQAFQVPSQYFRIQPNRITQIRGRLGTIIVIDPQGLRHGDGSIPVREIQIELQELQDQQSLIRNNAPTLSNDRLLESGGAYYINARTSQGQLYIEQRGAVSVQFRQINNQDMDLFDGQANNIGVANWTAPRSILKPQSNQVYAPIALEKFGWYNCDRFYQGSGARTEVRYDIQAEIPIQEAMVYLIFKEFNAVVSSLYNSKVSNRRLDIMRGVRRQRGNRKRKEDYIRLMGSLSPNGFRNMPIDSKAQFLAVANSDGQIFASLTGPIVLTQQHFQKFSLTKVDAYEYEDLLSRL